MTILSLYQTKDFKNQQSYKHTDSKEIPLWANQKKFRTTWVELLIFTFAVREACFQIRIEKSHDFRRNISEHILFVRTLEDDSAFGKRRCCVLNWSSECSTRHHAAFSRNLYSEIQTSVSEQNLEWTSIAKNFWDKTPKFGYSSKNMNNNPTEILKSMRITKFAMWQLGKNSGLNQPKFILCSKKAVITLKHYEQTHLGV